MLKCNMYALLHSPSFQMVQGLGFRHTMHSTCKIALCLHMLHSIPGVTSKACAGGCDASVDSSGSSNCCLQLHLQERHCHHV